MNALFCNRKCQSGFTLLELLAVMLIMGTVLACSIPMFTAFSQSSNLTSAGQLLSDQIKLAAQTASARNAIVEVRLIKADLFPDNTSGYRAVQLWMPASSGTLQAIDKMLLFPQGVSLSENAAFSPLLTQPLIVTGTLSGGAAKNASYVAFRIHPSGFFEPVPAQASKANLYVTLLNSRFAADASLPPNYVTVQISPITCATLLYRP